jgi:hypothetical protein
VLIHDENEYAIHMRELYDNMDFPVKHIQCDKYSGHIHGDLKVITILLGLQLCYMKIFCFLCEWDNQTPESHYSEKHGNYL